MSITISTLRYELILWITALLELVPGKLGCKFRNFLLPYSHGKRVLVWDRVHIEHPRRLCLGNDVSVNRGTIIHAGGTVTVGNNVLIGPNVIIYSQNHQYRLSGLTIDAQGYERKPVKIGSNVWIGSGAIILPGIQVGDHSVIAAGSVVTKDVPAHTLVAGNPARAVRELME